MGVDDEMCGRYFLDMEFEKILSFYNFINQSKEIEFQSGEIFPSQSVLVVDKNELRTMRWGMKYDFLKKLLINSRVETISEKRLFKEAFKQRRVILPANSYYEWEKTKSGNIKREIRINDQGIMSFAGIYNSIQMGNEWVESVVIVTEAATDSLSKIHNRMPLIIPHGLEQDWINSENPLMMIESIKQMKSFEFNVF